MLHNGTELEIMTYNGQEVDVWIHNGVEVWTALPEELMIYINTEDKGDYELLSEYVTGLPCSAYVADSSQTSGESVKTVQTPFALTSLAKEKYSTCTFEISYALVSQGRYGSASASYDGVKIAGSTMEQNVFGSKEYVISTNDTPKSITAQAKGNVDYTAPYANVWISKVVLSGKK